MFLPTLILDTACRSVGCFAESYPRSELDLMWMEVMYLCKAHKLVNSGKKMGQWQAHVASGLPSKSWLVGFTDNQLPKIMWMCPTLIPEAPCTDSPQQPVFVVDPIQQKREQPMWARLRVQPKKVFSSKTKPKRRNVLKISQPVHLPSGQVDGLTKHLSSCSASRTWTADACAWPSSWIKPPKGIPWYWQLPWYPHQGEDHHKEGQWRKCPTYPSHCCRK